MICMDYYILEFIRKQGGVAMMTTPWVNIHLREEGSINNMINEEISMTMRKWFEIEAMPHQQNEEQ